MRKFSSIHAPSEERFGGETRTRMLGLRNPLTGTRVLAATDVPAFEGFSYCSNTNDQWLGPDEIRELVAAP